MALPVHERVLRDKETRSVAYVLHYSLSLLKDHNRQRPPPDNIWVHNVSALCH